MKKATNYVPNIKKYIDDYIDNVLTDFSSNAISTIAMTLNPDNLAISIKIEDGEREFTKSFVVDSNTDLDSKFAKLKLLYSIN